MVTAVTGRECNANATTATLSPRDNIQNAVDGQLPGTTFVLQPGIYREASVTSSKDGDSFIGRPGAIMDGAKQLTGWMRGRYTASIIGLRRVGCRSSVQNAMWAVPAV
jgi:hypothetical protein